MAPALQIQVRFYLLLPVSLFLSASLISLRTASTEPPFDRHDWIVRRKTGEEVRYVIDYYSAPPEPDGSPVFSLDVRPALDSIWSVKSRLSAATEDAWAAFKPEKSSDRS